MPRQPKLRSSCDGCGAAKLKCDRGQPSCGRCLSLDLDCVYGVSRKTGKPPREKVRLAGEAPSTSSRSGDQSRNPPTHPHLHSSHNGNNAENHRRTNGITGSGLDGFSYEDMVQNSGSILDGHSVNMMIAPDGTSNDLFRPLLPSFGTMDFDDSLFSDIENATFPTTLATPESGGYATPATQIGTPQTQVDDERYLDSALLQQLGNNKGHDCFREAYDILGSLSAQNLNSLNSTADSPPASSTASSTSRPASSAQMTRVPLDHVLRLNREASERLGRLLNCSCARVPQLTMLFASIISQILVWYQQAAGCTQNTSWSSTDLRLDAASASASHQTLSLTGSSPNSAATTGTGPSRWSTPNRMSAGGDQSTPTMFQFSGPVAPAKMAVGTFDIDDLRIQNALKIQLLSGEMKRIGRLIDQFALHNFDGQCVNDNYTFSSVHSLYQSLDAWLRGEHSRISNMMKAKLREFNT